MAVFSSSFYNHPSPLPVDLSRVITPSGSRTRRRAPCFSLPTWRRSTTATTPASPPTAWEPPTPTCYFCVSHPPAPTHTNHMSSASTSTHAKCPPAASIHTTCCRGRPIASKLLLRDSPGNTNAHARQGAPQHITPLQIQNRKKRIYTANSKQLDWSLFQFPVSNSILCQTVLHILHFFDNSHYCNYQTFSCLLGLMSLLGMIPFEFT